MHKAGKLEFSLYSFFEKARENKTQLQCSNTRSRMRSSTTYLRTPAINHRRFQRLHLSHNVVSAAAAVHVRQQRLRLAVTRKFPRCLAACPNSRGGGVGYKLQPNDGLQKAREARSVSQKYPSIHMGDSWVAQQQPSHHMRAPHTRQTAATSWHSPLATLCRRSCAGAHAQNTRKIIRR